MPRIEEYDNQGNLINVRYEGTPQEEAQKYIDLLQNLVQKKIEERVPYYRLIRLALGDVPLAEQQKIQNFLDAMRAEYQAKKTILDNVTTWEEFDQNDFISTLDAIDEAP